MSGALCCLITPIRGWRPSCARWRQIIRRYARRRPLYRTTWTRAAPGPVLVPMPSGKAGLRRPRWSSALLAAWPTGSTRSLAAEPGGAWRSRCLLTGLTTRRFLEKRNCGCSCRTCAAKSVAGKGCRPMSDPLTDGLDDEDERVLGRRAAEARRSPGYVPPDEYPPEKRGDAHEGNPAPPVEPSTNGRH